MVSPADIDDAFNLGGIVDRYEGSSELSAPELGDIVAISRLEMQCSITASVVRGFVMRSSIDPGSLPLSTCDRA